MNRPQIPPELDNAVLKTIFDRKSLRKYDSRQIPQNIKDIIIHAAIRAPTAGNMMFYSMIDITKQELKDNLAKTCDNQPFIAKAPFVLLFVIDFQRWYDLYTHFKVPENLGKPLRPPSESDFLLATWDALIAAQNAVIAAESLGIGSCYIGDIVEHYEENRDLFGLPPLVMPMALLCFGYKAKRSEEQKFLERFPIKYVLQENSYRRITKEELIPAFKHMIPENQREKGKLEEIFEYYAKKHYERKTGAEFSFEMDRSVKKMLETWKSYVP